MQPITLTNFFLKRNIRYCISGRAFGSYKTCNLTTDQNALNAPRSRLNQTNKNEFRDCHYLREFKRYFTYESHGQQKLLYNRGRENLSESDELGRGKHVVASFPMEEVTYVELERITESLLKYDECGTADGKNYMELSSHTSLLNAEDILSSDYAKAMKGWMYYSGNEKAATSTEMILCRVMELVEKIDYDVGRTSNDHFYHIREVAQALVILHNMAIQAWAKSKAQGSAEEAEMILVRMMELSDKTKENAKPHVFDLIRPDLISFNSVLNAWVHSNESFAAHRAQEVFSLMKSQNDDILPDIISYNTLMNAWAKSRGDSRESLTRMMDIFEEMKSSALENDNSDIEPTTVTYNTALSAIAKSGQSDAGTNAQAILEKMEKLSTEKNSCIKPDTISYSNVINAWAKSGQIGAALRAEDVLYRMQEINEKGNIQVRPNTYCFNSVINAWAYSKLKDSAEKAESILDLMIQLHEDGSENIMPDQISFNQVMIAYSRSRQPDIAKKVKVVFDKMEQCVRKGNERARPNSMSYSMLISVLLKSNEFDAARRAEKILERMETQYADGHIEAKADKVTYNSILKMWAKSTDRRSTSKAEDLVRRMLSLCKKKDRSDLEPDLFTYTTLIDVWSKSRNDDAGHQAERILNTVLGLSHIQPSTMLYNAVINSYASIHAINKDHVMRAREILNQMEESSEKNSYISPDIVTYNTVIKACARIGEAVLAEDLLNDMESSNSMRNKVVKPDEYTYNCVISAWARKKGSKEAAEHAQSLLHRMTKNLHAGPDTISFNTALNAWSNVGGPVAVKRADELLTLMEKATAMESNVKVNRKSYTSVLKSIERSRTSDIPNRVVNILERMMDQYENGNRDALPDSITYNAAIGAFKATEGTDDDKVHALRLLQIVFTDMQEAPNVEPDHITYKLMLQACEALINDGNEIDLVTKNVFQQACLDGRVNKTVFDQFRKISPTMFNKIVGSKEFEELPSDWKRRVSVWRPPKGRRNSRAYTKSKS